MKVVGTLLWVGGAALVGYAVAVFDPSVSSGYGRVVNLDLQQRQLIMVIVGAAVFLTGAILSALGFLLPDPSASSATTPPPRAIERQNGETIRSAKPSPNGQSAEQEAALWAALDARNRKA